MSQSKRGSAAEAVVNVFVGYVINVAAQAIVFPWFGLHTDVGTNMAIGGVFTGISLARSYTLRRLFNKRQTRAVEPPAWEGRCGICGQLPCNYHGHNPVPVGEV